MHSVKNLPGILDRIRSAGTPPRFTHEFLKSNLGFGSSNDRAVINLLRQLGFLSSDGTPTARYNQYRGTNSGHAVADGLREGWSELFLSDSKVHQKSGPELIGIVKNSTGSGDAVARKIATTFTTLAAKASFDATPQRDAHLESDADAHNKQDGTSVKPEGAPEESISKLSTVDLHHDIHIHLPPTSDVGVYRAIFQAMKSELL